MISPESKLCLEVMLGPSLTVHVHRHSVLNAVVGNIELGVGVSLPCRPFGPSCNPPPPPNECGERMCDKALRTSV